MTIVARGACLAWVVSFGGLAWQSVAVSAEIHDAVARDNAVEIKRSIESQPDALELKDRVGRTPLYVAAEAGHVTAVELLLRMKANPNSTADFGLTPLHAAASVLEPEAMIRALEAAGLSDAAKAAAGQGRVITAESLRFSDQLPGRQWQKFRDALMSPQAALAPNVLAARSAIVRLLVEHGAALNARSAMGQVPLVLALYGQNTSFAETLLLAGVDVEARDPQGNTPLILAASVGSDKTVDLLLTHGASIDATGNTGFTPLNAAARTGNTAVVKTLLGRRADIAIADREGFTPLQSAAESGYPEIVALLLAAGSQVDGRADDGRTALHCAAQTGFDDVVALLLSKGAPVDSVEQNGATALHFAAIHGHAAVSETLLEAGANIEARTRIDMTPLMAAAYVGKDEVVKVLLAHRADLSATDSSGNTALDIAEGRGYPSTATLLRDWLD